MSIFAFGAFDKDVLALADGVPNAVIEELGIAFQQLPRDADLVDPVPVNSIDKLPHLNLQGSNHVGGDRFHKPTVTKADDQHKGPVSGPPPPDPQEHSDVDKGSETATISDERAWQLARLIIDFYKEWKGL